MNEVKHVQKIIGVLEEPFILCYFSNSSGLNLISIAKNVGVRLLCFQTALPGAKLKTKPISITNASNYLFISKLQVVSK